jgi:hypothetical protein
LIGRFGPGCKISIGLTFFKQLQSRRPMLIGIIRLEDNIFVMLQLQPCETVEDRPRRLLGRSCDVGVFDTKQELAADLASV